MILLPSTPGLGPWTRRVLLVAVVTALAGCGKGNVQVYRVAKETPDSAAMANPHGASASDQNPHAMGQATERITYKLPAGWTEQASSSAMRVASFTVAGPDGQTADVSVIPLPGLGGRDADMVNMWRSQVQLPPAPPEEATKNAEVVAIGSQTGKLYEMVSTNKLVEDKYPARILAAILVRGDVAWFFKMVGPDTLVTGQKPAFEDFLKSVAFVGAPAGGPMTGAMPPMGGGMMEGMGGGSPAKPAWTVPSGWKEEPPSQMLVAKFTASEGAAQAEITVSAFPGDVGGLLANVNRWRGQVGLGPIAEADLPKAVSDFDAQGAKASVVDVDGTDPKTGQKTRLVGVIVPQATQTWFYKLMGDTAVVASQKEPLLKFVQGVKYPSN